MSQTEIIYLAASLCALFAFAYGFINLIKSKRGSFYSFVVLGFAGLALGRVFLLFLRIISPSSTRIFNIGNLGIFSGFVCIAFACNILEKTDSGEINNLVKYKHIALIMPAVYILYIIAMLSGGPSFDRMLVSYLYAISVMPCGYYCLRNIIIPHPAGSLMRSMRPFFSVVLAFCILSMLNELTWLWMDNDAFIKVSNVVLAVCGCACYIALPILLERGYKKWTQM